LLKIFTTQLVGYFKSIQENEEMNIEDSARAIAQAIVGDGNIYVHGKDEMNCIATEAVLGAEPMPKTSFLFNDEGKFIRNLSSLDRVIVATRFSNDETIVRLVKEIKESGATVIGISAIQEDDVACLATVCDFHIDTKLIQGLVPQDDGSRIGFPSSMLALYAYFGLSFIVKEMLEEYDM
jgi:DNA-binding MurR/RpiR family transcriptional regulator